MGGNCSKNDAVNAAAPSLPTPATANDLSTGDLSSYLSACQSDTDLQAFDSALCEQTKRVLTTFSDGHRVPPLSLESLRAVTGCFAEVNQEAVKYILNSKRDVWNSPELLELVEQYFEYSDQVLTFFNALDTCLRGAQDRQLIIDLALHFFEEESKDINGNGGVEGGNSVRFAKTLQELRKFKEEGNPFSEDFVALLKSVQKQQMLMLYKLKAKHRKLDKKMKSFKTFRKVSLVIFVACFTGAIILSVVAAAVAAPPVVTALAAAMSASMGGMGKWLDSLWNKYENEVKAKIEMIDRVEKRTSLTVMELENIRVLVSKLEIEIEALLRNAELPLRDDSTVVVVVVVIEDVKKKLSGVTKAIAELEEHAATYRRDITQVRTVILHGIRRTNSGS